MKKIDQQGPNLGNSKIVREMADADGSRRTLPSIILIAEKAGKEVFRIFQDLDRVTTRLKEDRSPVSNADILSNTLIMEGLRNLDPTVPIISEETTTEGSREPFDRSPVWLVDPLDGTKEFLNGIGEFTVNIALVVDGSPVLGVVHIPATGQTFCAVKGHGAFVQEQGKSRRLLPNPPPSKPYRVLTSRYHAPVTHADAGSFEIVPCGSSLKFCRLAEGAAQIYPRFAPTMEWDTAAGHCLVEETGGAVVDLEGHPLIYNKSSLTNPHFIAVSHPSLLNDTMFKKILSFRES